MTSREDLGSVTGARLEMLRRLGFGELTHDSHVPFMSHLIGTRRVLAEWGCSPELCDAGLFHSAYGTEYFDLVTEATRPEIAEIIGANAERIAWLWCTIRRDEIDVDASTALDRHTGEVIDLAANELADLATLWAADTVEQLARMAPEERSFADGLPRVLHLALPQAQMAAEAALADVPS